jgi:hypothetical protein
MRKKVKAVVFLFLMSAFSVNVKAQYASVKAFEGCFSVKEFNDTIQPVGLRAKIEYLEESEKFLDETLDPIASIQIQIQNNSESIEDRNFDLDFPLFRADIKESENAVTLAFDRTVVLRKTNKKIRYQQNLILSQMENEVTGFRFNKKNVNDPGTAFTLRRSEVSVKDCFLPKNSEL